MAFRVAWGITGAGDRLAETIAAMETLAATHRVEITVVLSKAAVMVVRWYKLQDRLESVATAVLTEKNANAPFIVGDLQTGLFDCLVVAPASANTVAKIVHGIADTVITNAVAQTAKTNVPIYVLPVDQQEGTTVTTLPDGSRLELKVRAVDAANAGALAAMQNISVIAEPHDIVAALGARQARDGAA